jgi:hypothetical protein
VSFDSTSLVGPTLPVEDIALLFVIDMAGDKVIMAPIISEDPSYEGNELKKYSSIKVCYFLTLKVEVKGFEYLILFSYSVKMHE